MQARLAQFPRYRAVSSGALRLADLQGLLRPGEAYYKMLDAGRPCLCDLRHLRHGARLPDRRDPARARPPGRCAAGDHLGGREQPAAHLSVRSRAAPTASTRPCSRRSRARSGRSPISSSSPTGRCCGCRPTCSSWIAPRSTPIARGRPPIPMTTASISAASNGWGASATSRPRSRSAPSATSARRRRAGPAPQYLGFGENAPARGYILPARHAGVRAGRLHLVARRLEPADLGARAGRGRRGGGRGPRRRGRDRHRRRLHRHRDHRRGTTSTNIASSISPRTAW